MNPSGKRISLVPVKRPNTDFSEQNPAQIKIIRAVSASHPNVVRFPLNQYVNDKRQIVFDTAGDQDGNLIISDQQSKSSPMTTQFNDHNLPSSSLSYGSRNLASGGQSDKMFHVNRGSKIGSQVTVESMIDDAQCHDSNQQSTSSSNLKQDRRQPSPVRVLGEQERFLPLANIGRIMKRYMPDSGKVAKDAKECMQECVSEFISFVASEASEKCRDEKRKTITGEDILYAMDNLGLEPFVEPLKTYLQKYRAAYKGDKMQMEDYDLDEGMIIYPEMEDQDEFFDTRRDQDQNGSQNINDRSSVVSLTNEQLNALLQSGQLVLTPVNVSPGQLPQSQNHTRNASDTVILTSQEASTSHQQIPVLYLDQNNSQIQQNSNGVQIVQIVASSNLSSNQQRNDVTVVRKT